MDFSGEAIHQISFRHYILNPIRDKNAKGDNMNMQYPQIKWTQSNKWICTVAAEARWLEKVVGNPEIQVRVYFGEGEFNSRSKSEFDRWKSQPNVEHVDIDLSKGDFSKELIRTHNGVNFKGLVEWENLHWFSGEKIKDYYAVIGFRGELGRGGVAYVSVDTILYLGPIEPKSSFGLD